MKYIITTILASLILAGCSCKAKEETIEPKKEAIPIVSQETDILSELYSLLDRIDRLIEDGNTTDAINQLNKALSAEKYAQVKGEIFSRLIRLLMATGNTQKARSRYLKAVKEKDNELARYSFGLIYNYYRQHGNTNALMEWTEELVQAPLPANLAKRAFIRYLDLIREKGELSRLLKLVPVCAEKFDAATTYDILSRTMNSLLSSGNYANAQQFLKAIKKESAKVPALKVLAAHAEIDLMVLQNKWAEAEQQFITLAPILPDKELAACLRRAVSAAGEKGKFDIVNRLCSFVLKTQEGKDRSKVEAAKQYLKLAREEKDIDKIITRLESLTGFGLPPTQIFYAYNRQFYFILKHGTPEQIARLLHFSDSLEPLLVKTSALTEIKIMALDNAFVLEDYKGALMRLEKGIPEKDKEWHEMSSTKLKAHLALQEGKKKEAIRLFRKFMDYVSVEQDLPVPDPLTGIQHTKEMCLGFNAKRIGDILKSMKDNQGSQKAYKEAKELYLKTLSEVKPESKEYNYIQTQIAKISAEQKNP